MKTYSLTFTMMLLTALVAIPNATSAQHHRHFTMGATNQHQVELQHQLDNGLFVDNDEDPTAIIPSDEGITHVMVEMEDPPTTQIFADVQANDHDQDATAAAQAQLARIENNQQALMKTLATLDTTVLFQTQRVYNGIALTIETDKLLELSRLPGIKAVHPLHHHDLDHTTSVPIIGAPDFWESMNPSMTGKGLKIGIIDSGIDYLHANFGGSGKVRDFKNNNTKVITDQLSIDYFGPTKKVVGGHDFVGDAYNSRQNTPPQPDPDPMDCGGHGSHVAGTVAGLGVNANGTTYTGPYNAKIPFDTLRIGPGVAPSADLYALRVFGCEGSTNMTTAAIEWAVDPDRDGNFSDRLDVINMSLGSTFGDPQDPTAVASDNAAKAGVIVVVSAGNSENSYYTVGAPSVANYAISVAGTADSSSVIDGFRVNAPSQIAGVHPADLSSNFRWSQSKPITRTVVYPTKQVSGCQPFDPKQTAVISGNIVLLDWTDNECASGTRADNATQAKAAGMILADNSAIFDLRIGGNNKTPAIGIPKAVGDKLKNALQSGPVEVTLSAEYNNWSRDVEKAIEDTVYNASSGGPRNGDSLLKPDLAAPGLTIFSTAVGTGNQGNSANGTSMAAPHVAGMMALLRQIHPNWTVPELKALAMNTATKNVYNDLNRTGLTYGPSRVGAGRVNLPKAGKSEVLLYNTDNPELVSVSFGAVEIQGQTVITKSVTLKNKGTSEVNYNLSYVPSSSIPGIAYTLSKPSVNLKGGESTTVIITLNTNAAMMRNTRNPLVTETQGNYPRHYISEASGYLTLHSKPQTIFSAQLSGNNEAPPVDSTVNATAAFTYTESTGRLEYSINFTDNISISAPGAHLYSAPAGANGKIAATLIDANQPDTVFGPNNPLKGSTPLSKKNVALLRSGNLYVNIHTKQNPQGELRGQIVPADEADLRLPIHTIARSISDMKARSNVLNVGKNITGTTSIALDGVGLQDQKEISNLKMPVERLSLVSAFELQINSPKTSDPANAYADLQYVGIATNLMSTTTSVKPTDVISETMLYFGISTHGNWTAPVQRISIYIDTNGSGINEKFEGAEYRLFNTSLQVSNDPTNVFFTALEKRADKKSTLLPFPLNAVDAKINSALFNNNVLILPVRAGNLELNNTKSVIQYQVVAETRSNFIDRSDVVTYDISKPGVSFLQPLSGPIYTDLPNVNIPVLFDQAAFKQNNAQGVLLLHHHNQTNKRTDVIQIRDDAPAPDKQSVFIPLIHR